MRPTLERHSWQRWETWCGGKKGDVSCLPLRRAQLELLTTQLQEPLLKTSFRWGSCIGQMDLLPDSHSAQATATTPVKTGTLQRFRTCRRCCDLATAELYLTRPERPFARLRHHFTWHSNVGSNVPVSIEIQRSSPADTVPSAPLARIRRFAR